MAAITWLHLSDLHFRADLARLNELVELDTTKWIPTARCGATEERG